METAYAPSQYASPLRCRSLGAPSCGPLISLDASVIRGIRFLSTTATRCVQLHGSQGRCEDEWGIGRLLLLPAVHRQLLRLHGGK